MPINTPSRITLTQHGVKIMLNLEIKDTIIATIINEKIIKDILRKYFCSLSVHGFSGVSSGQKMNIKTANTKDVLSNTMLISYIFEHLISTMQHRIDRADIISHLVSVLAW